MQLCFWAVLALIRGWGLYKGVGGFDLVFDKGFQSQKAHSELKQMPDSKAVLLEKRTHEDMKTKDISLFSPWNIAKLHHLYTYKADIIIHFPFSSWQS